MATIRKKHRAPVSVFQRDPGPWSRLLIDWLATLAVIMIFGLVMLFSASYTTGYLRMGDSFHYIKQQALCMILGLGCMFLISYVDHRFLRKMVVPGYIIVLAMLAVTLTMAPLNGCRRWIRFAGLTLQSSEVAKFEMILFSSHLAAKAPQVERLDPERRILLTPREWLRVRVWKQLVVPVLPLIPVVILLAMEPHMSGIVLTVAVVGTILLLSGSGGVLTWAGAITAGALLETLLSHVDSIPYLQKRLDGWTQDLSQMTDQTVQSLYAIGSGGLKGLGLGNSVEKQLWLPESTNDFIFSVVCEELGFIGAVLIIVLFVLFIVQGLLIAYKAENLYCTMVGIGIMAQIAWQVFCNIAVVTNTLPNTGISLPFFSSGGTSLILLLAEMGVMVNIGRNGERAAQQREQMRAQREADAKRAREFREQMERAKENARSRGEAEAKRILRDARTAADQVFQELSEMRKAQAKAERMLNENEARAALRRTLNEAEEAVSRRDARQEPIPKPSRPIQKGDLVEIPGVSTPAEVVSVGSDGTLQLKAGILKMKAKADEVRLIEDDERAAMKKKAPKPTRTAVTGLRTAASRELDIRGMETLEAESVVENFISAAVMGKLETVTIIHGKGTGALRKAVHDILRRNKAVKSFRLGVYGEGESGVTVVTLK